MQKIYIAGPSVFAENAKAIGEEYKIICQKYGFEGLYPLDNECDGKKPQEIAMEIFMANLSSIEKADYVVADLNPFRGKCVDDGTAFEIGYATALEKPVYGFISDARSLRDRIGLTDDNGFRVEDFGFPVNLMIAKSTIIVKGGDFEDCISEIAEQPKGVLGCQFAY